MSKLIYNYDVQANKSIGSEIVEKPEEPTGIKNILTRILKNNTHVRALHGVEKALCRYGNNYQLKIRLVAAIKQQ